VTTPCIDCGWATKVHRAGGSEVIHVSCAKTPCDCGCHTAPPDFESIGASLGRLVAEKQAAYGDSFGKSGAVMRILYPAGIAADQVDDALTVVRILDKLFRVATARDALGESPFRDIGGYALLAQARVERARPGADDAVVDRSRGGS
jgi:hypothetical protein